MVFRRKEAERGLCLEGAEQGHHPGPRAEGGGEMQALGHRIPMVGAVSAMGWALREAMWPGIASKSLFGVGQLPACDFRIATLLLSIFIPEVSSVF